MKTRTYVIGSSCWSCLSLWRAAQNEAYNIEHLPLNNNCSAEGKQRTRLNYSRSSSTFQNIKKFCYTIWYVSYCPSPLLIDIALCGFPFGLPLKATMGEVSTPLCVVLHLIWDLTIHPLRGHSPQDLIPFSNQCRTTPQSTPFKTYQPYLAHRLCPPPFKAQSPHWHIARYLALISFVTSSIYSTSDI